MGRSDARTIENMMNNDPKKRQVHISYAKTGEVRMSKPVQVHAPRTQDAPPDVAAPQQLTPYAEPLSTLTEVQPVPPETDGAQPAPHHYDAAVTLRGPEIDAEMTAPSRADEPTSKGDGKGALGSKPKVDIQTLEQFIAYAFGRKGQRVKLHSKTEKLIAQHPRLDNMAMSRLLTMADGDALLAVPRQLLLVCREVEGLPALKAEISGFVSTVMLRHPIFSDAGVQASLRNLPEAPPPEVALKRVACYEPPTASGKDGPKPTELQSLRQNAVHLLTIWLASTRGLNLDELSKLLFQVVWGPAARELVDDNARLRALTEIEQAAGVGLVCDRFRQNVIEACSGRDQAQREASGLREAVAELRSQLEQAEIERDALTAELQALKTSSASELTEARKQHDVERTHLRHDHEQLRGRLVRRLSDSIEMLEVGLTALRNKTPRTEVMAERAEHVIDALRAEESNLREE
jgi:hypothetical protein